MTLRPYQIQALDEIRSHFGSGTRKVLLHAPTGSGKTTIFCTVTAGAQAKGKKVLLVVWGRKLVDQASRRLDREGVDHGVMMAGHWRLRPELPVQVCSISTLYSRKLAPPADLIIIDEAHMSCSPSYQWLVSQYPSGFFLPVTATPHVKQGLRHVADAVVYPATMKDLIRDGYLVPPVYYAPSRPDLHDVGIDSKTGDYKTAELSGAMQKANLYGDMVKSYSEIANGRPALLFCVDVAHSKAVVQSFVDAGIPAEHIDAKTPETLRDEVMSRLSGGVTKVVCNVGIMTTGVDIPCVSCIMLARPTKSYNLYIQIAGRGTRPFPGKENFMILDHANCVQEHGFITTERLCNLDGAPKGMNRSAVQIQTCKKCYYVWERSGGMVCPSCGTTMASDRERGAVVDSNFEMRLIEEFDIVKNKIGDLVKTAYERDYKIGWVFHKVVERFGEGVAKANFQFMKREREKLEHRTAD